MKRPPKTPEKEGVRLVAIDANRAGQRLDNFLLTQLKGVPKSRIYRIVRKGEVRINGGRVQPSRRLEEGDQVRIPPVRVAKSPAAKPGGDFGWLEGRVLYEDDALMVFDKPAGMAVHGGSRVGIGLIEALRSHRGEGRVLELVHRLDRGTSGCLLVAKNRAALGALHAQLRAGQIEKQYLALLRGRWRGGTRRVEAALDRRAPAAGEGKAAVSEFRPLTRYTKATLVEITLLTGRTHQARLHAAHLDYPIAGDDKHGDFEFNRVLAGLGLKRMFLHARALRFLHPVHDTTIAVEAELPPDLQAVLTKLSNEDEVRADHL